MSSSALKCDAQISFSHDFAVCMQLRYQSDSFAAHYRFFDNALYKFTVLHFTYLLNYI